MSEPSQPEAPRAATAPAEPKSAPAPAAPWPPPEDVSNGLRFAHLVEMQTKQHLAEVSATVYALLEVAVSRGVIPLDEYEKRRHLTVVREAERLRSQALVVYNETEDKYKLAGLPEIDCETRIPLCKARCCSFAFPLSFQDLNERVVRWNYAAPYINAQRESGYCVHNDETTMGCTIYAQRPAVCRTFDCRRDARIWIDFEKRIPAP